MDENLVTVNGVNITQYINRKTYAMNAEDIYASWENGNMITTRIPIRTKITGSFEVAVWGKNNMDWAAFLNLWNGAVEDGIVTLGVFVQNTNTFEAIEAYFETKSKAHEKLINGNYLDRVTFKIEER